MPLAATFGLTQTQPIPTQTMDEIEVDRSLVGMGWIRDVLAAVFDRLGQQFG